MSETNGTITENIIDGGQTVPPDLEPQQGKGNGHDPRTGRFLPGNGGGPGRKARSTERAYLDATFASVSLKDWRLIVAKALEEAKQGGRFGAEARRWLSDTLLPSREVRIRLGNIINLTDGSICPRLIVPKYVVPTEAPQVMGRPGEA